MNNKYLILDSERGFFLGSMSDYAVFSKNMVLDTTKAYSFKSEADLQDFVRKYIPNRVNHITPVKVTTYSTTDYVDAVDLIKAGYKEETLEMFSYLPVENKTLH